MHSNTKWFQPRMYRPLIGGVSFPPLAYESSVVLEKKTRKWRKRGIKISYMKVTLFFPSLFWGGGGYGYNRVPYRCARLYLFSASLNQCYSRKFHLDRRWREGKNKRTTRLWFLRGAVNKWIHLEAGVRPACILTPADESERRRDGDTWCGNGRGASRMFLSDWVWRVSGR